MIDAEGCAWGSKGEGARNAVLRVAVYLEVLRPWGQRARLCGETRNVCSTTLNSAEDNG